MKTLLKVFVVSAAFLAGAILGSCAGEGYALAELTDGDESKQQKVYADMKKTINDPRLGNLGYLMETVKFSSFGLACAHDFKA